MGQKIRHVQVAAVENHGFPERDADAFEVRRPELVPFRDHGQAVGVVQRVILAVDNCEQGIVDKFPGGAPAGGRVEGLNALCPGR